LKILRKHKIIVSIRPALNVTDGINIPSGMQYTVGYAERTL
jgi:hypothetical protein